MKRFIDVTSPDVWVKTPACTMTREIFAELTQRLDVRPISWNKVGKLLYETWPNRI